MRLLFDSFSGLLPRLDPRLLPEKGAQVAENVNLLGGTLDPFKLTSNVTTLPSADRKTIYPYNGAWLSWVNDVDVVKGPIAGDQRERIYYTGDGVPKVRMVRIRENSTAYTLGQKARWIEGDTVWVVTVAGTTAASEPAITGIAVGGTVIDGSVVWQKTSDTLVGADEFEYDLGIPQPTLTPSVTAQAQSATSWTRTWKYQYEDAAGAVSASGTLTEPGDITETTVGTVYELASKPAGPAGDTFIMYFDAYSSGGSYLGRLYPSTSAYAANSDFFLNGASTSASQVDAAVAPEATMTISYDTSRASDYEVTRNYVYTFVSDAGEEGPPSSVSPAADITPVQDAVVANIDVAVTGNYNITLKRIYRTVTSASGLTTYQYVDEIPIAQASYTDTKSDADLGETLPSTNWTAPPDGLAGLVVLPGGYLAGFVGNRVLFSEPLQPHAWPLDYELVIDHSIVGLAVNSAGLVVMTNANPYIMVGSAPDSTTSEKIDSNQACVSKRSIANVDDLAGSVLYASPDGLVIVVGSSAELITKQHYQRSQWQSLIPASMFAEVHDQRYFAFFTDTTLVLDFDEGLSALVTTDQDASGAYSDPETDILYLIDDTSIISWGTSSNRRTMEWTSKEFYVPVPVRWVCARVSAEGYKGDTGVTLKLKFYQDGVLVRTIDVVTGEIFKIPKMALKKVWSFGLETNVEVHSLLISTSVADR